MLPYIKIDTNLFAYMQFIFSFYQEAARSFMLFSSAFVHLCYLVLYFPYLQLLALDYFVKLGFFFFSFYIYLCASSTRKNLL